jgi:hypothetical protein
MTSINSPREKLKKVIGKLIDTKEDKTKTYSAQLGTIVNGEQVVDVSTRSNFVYARINGNYAEVVEVYNDSVVGAYDLKVQIYRRKNENFYRIYDKDVSLYRGDFGGVAGNTAPHGLSHSFGDGQFNGYDPVFVFQRQLLQPLGTVPLQTGGFQVYVYPSFYTYNNETYYFEGGYSEDLESLKPVGTDDGNVRYVTVYLDGASGQLGYLTGTPFYANILISNNTSYIPDLPDTSGMELCAIMLATGSTGITWNDMFDVRDFLNPGGNTVQLHPLNPDNIHHTGTLNSDFVIITGSPYFTGTQLTDVLEEILIQATGSSGLPNATQIGQILISTDGTTFSRKMPVTNLVAGWLINNQGYLIVGS